MNNEQLNDLFNVFRSIISTIKSKYDRGDDISEAEWSDLTNALGIVENSTANVIDALDATIEDLRNHIGIIYVKNKALERERLIANYENSTDSEVKELLEFVKKRGYVEMINYPFVGKYDDFKCEFYEDKDSGLKYIYYCGKKCYLKPNLSDPLGYVKSIVVEQDPDSPHRYFDDSMFVEEGDIVIDAGVAEGNFSLEIIEKAKKIYLVECDPDWVKALKLTFGEYLDKIVIVEKFLDEYDDDTHITIDTMVGNETVNYIKMDIEGAEQAALRGASKTIRNSKNIKCSICTYHTNNADREIHELLEDYGFDLHYSKGYFAFQDVYYLIHSDLRKALIHGRKLS